MLGIRAAKLIAFVMAIEAIFWAFGALSLHRGNPWRLFDLTALTAQITENLPNERRAPAMGWPLPGTPTERPHPQLAARNCGSAWGGSFTFGDDVTDAEAWPYLASLKLGCEIANRGVDGFSFDQTLLLSKTHPPHDSLIILGMSQAMIYGAASWTFTELADQQPSARLTKPFFRLDHGDLQLVPRPAPEVTAIMQHYQKDYYGAAWTAFRFPFTLSISLAIYRKFAGPDMLQFSPMAAIPEWAQQREIANKIIVAMAVSAQKNGNRFAVLLIPRPEDAANPSEAFAAMFRDLGAMMPNGTCLIDPSPEMQSVAAKLENSHPLTTKSGHYAEAANVALADGLLRGLADCEIRP